MSLQAHALLDHWKPRPQHARINAPAAAGDHTLVAAVPGKCIKVTIHSWVTRGDNEDVSIKSGSSTVLAGPFHMPTAGDGMSPPEALLGHFKTAAGEPLVINQVTGVGIGGYLTWIAVDPDPES